MLSSLVGVAAALYGVYDSYNDLRALTADEQNGRRILARGGVRNHALRAIIFVAWALLGLSVIGEGNTDVPISFGIIALIGTNVVLAVLTVLDVRDRVRVRERIEQAMEGQSGSEP